MYQRARSRMPMICYYGPVPGALSPYPTVVCVTIDHHSLPPHSFSQYQTARSERVGPRTTSVPDQGPGTILVLDSV
eukprot:596175-Rhodomonas_salina.2